MLNNRVKQWNKSYLKGDNFIFFPKEEVVKFLNRFVRKKISNSDFIDIMENASDGLKSLDYGCGIGRVTNLLDEFGLNPIGVDISSVAINEAKKNYPNLTDNFISIDSENLPFEDKIFDIIVCESVIDSMQFELAIKVIKEIWRVSKKLVFISFISGDDSENFREYRGEKTITNDHEYDTIQSWYNWSKIEELLSYTAYEIIWARHISEESLIDKYKSSRYYLVLSK